MDEQSALGGSVKERCSVCGGDVYRSSLDMTPTAVNHWSLIIK